MMLANPLSCGLAGQRMQSDQLRRREFISLLGGAAAAWPSVLAQQKERVRRIGVLNTFAAEDSEGQARIVALLQALQALGWSVGTPAHRPPMGEPTPRPLARTLRNWSRSRPTSSWPE
jgi:hypothetical protein